MGGGDFEARKKFQSKERCLANGWVRKNRTNDKATGKKKMQSFRKSEMIVNPKGHTAVKLKRKSPAGKEPGGA